jgi:sortase A
MTMEQRIEGTLPPRTKWHRALWWTQWLLLVVGGILLAVFAIARIHGRMSSGAALQQFDRERVAAQSGIPADDSPLPGEDDVDFSLWSKNRIQAFKESLPLKKGPALAVLALDRLRIRVPVFEGTDDWALNRGAGWIAGTARPGETGNVGIAGHRDGFFRGLKDVEAGDLIELQLPDQTMAYRVLRAEIVQPEEVRVLMPTDEPTLTLVTCYPFYFVGSAPQRFIVRAALQQAEPAQIQRLE